MLDIQVSLRKTSLVDYPGKIAVVIFLPGCNLRCPWCQNRELVLGGKTAPGAIPLEEALEQIERRRQVLGGVVLSGGEPTLYRDLPALIRRIKDPGRLGLPVKLDTNGTFPAVLEELLSRTEPIDTRPDYIAMDLKIAPSRYAELLSIPKGADNIGGHGIASLESAASALALGLEKSAALIRASGIAHEFRSLVLPGGFFTPADREALAALAGDSPWNFRPFRPGNCLDPAWDEYTEVQE
ncbi:anaerobic ribonucleoside-triphosphate reductase activating protein [Spirochaetia bacterium]|nr:anaerobic ribonucleoside-triphosphate reductase activating protein [Spirochaetia bacterium]